MILTKKNNYIYWTPIIASILILSCLDENGDLNPKYDKHIWICYFLLFISLLMIIEHKQYKTLLFIIFTLVLIYCFFDSFVHSALTYLL